MFSVESIVGVVESALNQFVQAVEEKYDIKVGPEVWINTCQTVLKSGPRTGQICGKPPLAGKFTCSSHSKAPVQATPQAKTTGPKTQIMIRTNAYQQFVDEHGFVFANSRKVKGMSGADGAILPLTHKDIALAATFKLGIDDSALLADGVSLPSLPVPDQSPHSPAIVLTRSTVESIATVNITTGTVDENVDDHTDDLVEEHTDDIVDDEIVDDSEEFPL